MHFIIYNYIPFIYNYKANILLVIPLTYNYNVIKFWSGAIPLGSVSV